MTFITKPITDKKADKLEEPLVENEQLPDLIMATFVLMAVLCATTDRRNMEVHRSLYALYSGLTVAAIGLSLGFNSTFPLNPARDFAPRIFLTMAGYGPEPFTYRFIYWIPFIGPHIGAALGALTYLLGSFVLMVVICAVTDRRNMEIHRSLYGLYTGLTVAAIGMSLGYNGGYPLNPARDMSPRLFLTIAGWGPEPFWYRIIYWIPILGPHLGALLGALCYVFLVEVHLLDLEP